MATDFAQRSHHTGTNKKVFITDCWESRMIGNNVLFPLFNRRQCRGFPDFLLQAIHESRQFSGSVVTLICCSGGVNEIIGNWNRNKCHRQGNIDCAHPCLTTMYKSTQKQTRNHGGPVLVCPKGRTSKDSQNQNAPPENTKKNNSWDYLQISWRRCSRRKFIRAIWSM